MQREITLDQFHAEEEFIRATGGLPPQRAGSVQMADGDGQRIGDVGGLRRRGQIQQARDHHLHLRLLRPAVSDHRRLDRQRRIGDDLQAGLRGDQHGDAAHMSQLQRRLSIHRVEDIFDGHLLRRVGAR